MVDNLHQSNMAGSALGFSNPAPVEKKTSGPNPGGESIGVQRTSAIKAQRNQNSANLLPPGQIPHDLAPSKASTELGPKLCRDLTTPQESEDTRIAYASSAAMVVQESSKTGRKESTFLQLDPELPNRLRNFFGAITKFVDRPIAAGNDHGVHGELKGLMDKGFNPAYGGIGRFPSSDDSALHEKFMGWADKKYDKKNPGANQEVLEIQKKTLEYLNEAVETCTATKDPHVLDNLAGQFHSTIGQIVNDVLCNDKLNLKDRMTLYNDLLDAGILAGGELEPEGRKEALEKLSAFRKNIRGSPLLMEFQIPKVAEEVADKALTGLKRALGKRYAAAKEVLSDALMRDPFGGLDKLAGRRGRFRDINSDLALTLNRREKPLEKNVMNLPDGLLDDAALESVPNLCGERGDGREMAEKFVQKIAQGEVFAHYSRPNTAQRKDVLPHRLRELASPPDPKGGETIEGKDLRILSGAVHNELRFCDETIAKLQGKLATEGELQTDEVAKLKEELAGHLKRRDTLTELSAAFQKARMQAIAPNALSPVQQRLRSLKNELAERRAQMQFTRTSMDVSQLERQIAALEQYLKLGFAGLEIRDEQGRTHRMGDLAVEKTMAAMIHSHHQRTICSISGTTTDIGLAMVSQYGTEKIKAITSPLLQMAEKLRVGEDPGELTPELKSLFSSICLFMQGGQYHTPAEVLGGLLILGATLKTRHVSGNAMKMKDYYQALLSHFTKKPEAFLITDSKAQADFRNALPDQQRTILEKHAELIGREAKANGLRYWASTREDSTTRHGYFDDSSVMRPGPLTGGKTQDDFGMRPTDPSGYPSKGGKKISKQQQEETLKQFGLDGPINTLDNDELDAQEKRFNSNTERTHSFQEEFLEQNDLQASSTRIPQEPPPTDYFSFPQTTKSEYFSIENPDVSHENH